MKPMGHTEDERRPVPRSVERIRETREAIAAEASRIEIEERRAERAFMIEAARARKADARMKIVLGALVLEAVERRPELLAMVREVVNNARPRDWALFQDTILSDNPYVVHRLAGGAEFTTNSPPDAGRSAERLAATGDDGGFDPVLASLVERFEAVETVAAEARRLVERTRGETGADGEDTA